ncbi:hypothetical protein CPLU01_13649 [Colletotrichum plurivorum]|uniref:Uncharacterized protein n=1 Tax=Colletotrichum plurivorum TaxID=2175906 RepID=A0A8H6N1T7_9PEZI|nr:hypothetical protein CPLU01_13649 [Colletotrichum plurivorum]
MPARLPLLLKDVGFVDVNDKVFNSFGIRDMLQEPIRKVAIEVVRPLMLAVLEDGGMDTIQALEDVDRLEADMKREVAANDAKFGFHYYWTWGRRP